MRREEQIMMDETARRAERGTLQSTVLFFGALWGIVEATLGFALHALPRVMPIPNLAGAVMFPVALLVMVAAIRATGRPAAAMGAAIVAASIKASSVALPMVPFLFVRNPVMAILAEGGIVTIAAMVWVRTPRSVQRYPAMIATVAGWALAVSLGWRALFLGMNLVLGITNGILARPVEMIAQFLVVESLWNAGVILLGGLLVAARVSSFFEHYRETRKIGIVSFSGYRVYSVLAILMAVAAEWGIATLPL
jgi:hypothetical protein